MALTHEAILVRFKAIKTPYAMHSVLRIRLNPETRSSLRKHGYFCFALRVTRDGMLVRGKERGIARGHVLVVRAIVRQIVRLPVGLVIRCEDEVRVISLAFMIHHLVYAIVPFLPTIFLKCNLQSIRCLKTSKQASYNSQVWFPGKLRFSRHLPPLRSRNICHVRGLDFHQGKGTCSPQERGPLE